MDGLRHKQPISCLRQLRVLFRAFIFHDPKLKLHILGLAIFNALVFVVELFLHRLDSHHQDFVSLLLQARVPLTFEVLVVLFLVLSGLVKLLQLLGETLLLVIRHPLHS